MKRIRRIAELLGDAVWVLSRATTAVILLYKAVVLNDISFSVAQDPMEMWLAVGIATLIADSLRTRRKR